MTYFAIFFLYLAAYAPIASAALLPEIYGLEDTVTGVVGDDQEVGSSDNIGIYVQFGTQTEIISNGNVIMGSRSIQHNGGNGDILWMRDADFTAFNSSDEVLTMAYCYRCFALPEHLPTLNQASGPDQTQIDSNTGAVQICDGLVHFNHWNSSTWFTEMQIQDAPTAVVHIYDQFCVNSNEGEAKHDPHIVGFDGSRFDLFGKVDQPYNFLSDRGISVNALLFKPEYSIEHATYIGTAAIIVGNLEVVVHRNRTAYIAGKPVKEGLTTLGEVTITHIRDLKVIVVAPSYRMEVTFIKDDVMGGIKYLNLGFSIKNPSSPHGIVGRSGRVMLQLEAELEPFVEEDYEMKSLFSTDYKYSQFEANELEAMTIRKPLSVFDPSLFATGQATRI